jgi:hypothetical protein
MTPVEIIALIFALVVLLKMVLLLFIKPDAMLKLAEKMFKRKGFMIALFLVLIVVLGAFLLGEMSIVQIMAAGLFGIFVYALIFALYPEEYLKLVKATMHQKKKAWLYFVVWVVLALWVLYALFV